MEFFDLNIWNIKASRMGCGGQTETKHTHTHEYFRRANVWGRMTWNRKGGRGWKIGAFKMLPLQFRRWEWADWIMDPFIGLEKKEEQQSWYQAGLKPLDLWGFSAVAGGQFESSIYQLRTNQTRPSVLSAFHMQNLTFASSQLDLLKHDWSKSGLHASVCKYVRRGARAGAGSGAAHAGLGFKARSLQRTPEDSHGGSAGALMWKMRIVRQWMDPTPPYHKPLADVWLTICSRISCWPVMILAKPEHADEYIYEEKASVGAVYHRHKPINCDEIMNVPSYVDICFICFEMIKYLY